MGQRVKFSDTPENDPAEPVQTGQSSGIDPDSLLSLTGFRLHRTPGGKIRPGDCNILCSYRVMRKIRKHLEHDKSREHGGLLLGYETRCGNEVSTVVITHSLPAQETTGSPTHVTFGEPTWNAFDSCRRKIEELGLDLQTVGWYHSHPGIEIFLSAYDLDVCKTFDSRKNPVALVIDPKQNKAGFFVRGAEGYEPHNPIGFWEFDADPQESSPWNNMTTLSAGSVDSGEASSLNPVGTNKRSSKKGNTAAGHSETRQPSRLLMNVVAALVLIIVAGSAFTVYELNGLRAEIANLARRLTSAEQSIPPAGSASAATLETTAKTDKKTAKTKPGSTAK